MKIVQKNYMTNIVNSMITIVSILFKFYSNFVKVYKPYCRNHNILPPVNHPDSQSSIVRTANFETGLRVIPLVVLTSAKRICPSLAGNNLTIRPFNH